LLHKYVYGGLVPLTVRFIDPLDWPHVLPPMARDRLGRCNTVTTTVAEAEQPPLTEPVTVYVVVVAGDATTAGPLVVFKPVPGAHE